MKPIIDKELEKLRKVYEIYLKGGSEGEKNSAKKILDGFCDIYKITFDELIIKIGGVGKNEEYFEIPKIHNQVIHQIIYKVVGHFHFRINTEFSKKYNYIILECTSNEKKEIDKLINFYIPIYKKELEEYLKKTEKDFFKAFVTKNRLVPDDKIKDIPDNISLEEIEKQLKVYEIMREMNNHNIPGKKKELPNNLKLI